MSFFSNIPNQKTILFLMLMVILKMSVQLAMETPKKEDPLKLVHELTDFGEVLVLDLIKQGKFDDNLVNQKLTKFTIAILCNGNFESQTQKMHQKFHEKFCEQLENGESMEKAAENVKEMITKTEIPKPIVDNKLIEEKIEEISILNEVNKENLKKFVKLSNLGLKGFEQSFKATIAPFFQHSKTIKNRRKKRMDNNNNNNNNNEQRNRLINRKFSRPIAVLKCIFSYHVVARLALDFLYDYLRAAGLELLPLWISMPTSFLFFILDFSLFILSLIMFFDCMNRSWHGEIRMLTIHIRVDWNMDQHQFS